MKTRMIVTLALSALVLGGTVVTTGVASASDGSMKAAEKAAASNAGKAAKALAQHDVARAIGFAEAAVLFAPRDAAYRMTLAQSYLQAGRFASARQAFADVLALSPGNGKAALDLALAQTATGDWPAARKTLDENARIIPVGDLGLALALAGDPQAAVSLLMDAARSPQASPKIRQNLALSLALAGQWGAARIAASADMSPADVDTRIQQWAAFAQPAHASDQVASLLGVTTGQDAGQPVALTLNAPAPVGMPVEVAATQPVVVRGAPAIVAMAVPAVPAPAPLSPALAKVVFGPSREVVQAVPVQLIHSDPRATKVAVAVQAAVAAQVAKGDWYIQLGAYENAGVARDGWNRARRRFASFGSHQPTGMTFPTKAGSFYRLSVGGFARADADRMCRGYRRSGGACFVRRNGGDQMAQWLGKSVQLASR